MSVGWYQWPSVERQLVVFAKSFLGPHAFTVRLEDDRWICPTGSCDFNQHAIVVNPTACDGAPQAQYLVTRGLLAHEVGHARYTTPRDGTAPVVQQLTNILEDERVERIMGGQFWSVRAALTAVSRYAYTVSRPLGEPHGNLQDPDDPRWVVLAALQWRWAVRLGEPLKGAVGGQRAALDADPATRGAGVGGAGHRARVRPGRADRGHPGPTAAAGRGDAAAPHHHAWTSRRRRRASSQPGRGLDRPGRRTRPGRSGAYIR